MRQREFSLRQALCAGRSELLRQLLTESLILVSAGGALAWGFAEMATRLLGRWAQIESSLAPDRTVLLFTLGMLAVAGLLFGLAPLRVALAGRAELAIKTSAATSHTNEGKSRMGRMIVALQVTLCVVLLVSAGLLIRRQAQHTMRLPSRGQTIGLGECTCDLAPVDSRDALLNFRVSDARAGNALVFTYDLSLRERRFQPTRFVGPRTKC
jgi:hypothetical protein